MIRVLIERRIASGMHDEMVRVLLKIRGEASFVAGYVSGQTLVNVDDPEHYLVISTWLSREAWESWWASDIRHKCSAELMGLMIEPEVINIFEHI